MAGPVTGAAAWGTAPSVLGARPADSEHQAEKEIHTNLPHVRNKVQDFLSGRLCRHGKSLTGPRRERMKVHQSYHFLD